jgi:hypothetical protein
MSEQQCFQDVAGKIIDVDAKRSQLLSWVDSFANVFGKSFVFDKYYLFLASLLVDLQQVVYANYNEKRGIINLLAFFEENLIHLHFKDPAFESPPFIEKGLSPFFVDALRQKLQAAVEAYKAKRKNYQDLFYVPFAEKRVPVPVEFENKLRNFTYSSRDLNFSPRVQFYLESEHNEFLKIYTPFLNFYGTRIRIYIKEINLDEPISTSIPVDIVSGTKSCGLIYINVLELATGSIKLSEQCHIITKQDEPIANKTLCEALNKLVGYADYALGILRKLTLKGATTLTTLLLY